MMKVPFYLTVNSRGAVRATKTQVGLAWDEISIKVNISLPDALFKKPILSAEINIPEDAAIQSPIDAEVIENVKEAIKQSTNLEFNLRVINHEDDN